VLAIVLSADDWRQRGRLIAVFCGLALLVSGWWLIRNMDLYGDPLALRAADEHLHRAVPLQFAGEPPLELNFVKLPQTVWKEFWYRSQQFMWPWWAYLPFWLLTAGGLLANLKRGGSLAASVPARALVVLLVLTVGAFATVWVVGAAAAQGRLAFIGLPALACLVALGCERLPGPIAWRFTLPALGFIGTLVAVRHDIIDVYL
jgi:hypothetical protein